jgi:hypothetical protein
MRPASLILSLLLILFSLQSFSQRSGRRPHSPDHSKNVKLPVRFSPITESDEIRKPSVVHVIAVLMAHTGGENFMHFFMDTSTNTLLKCISEYWSDHSYYTKTEKTTYYFEDSLVTKITCSNYRDSSLVSMGTACFDHSGIKTHQTGQIGYDDKDIRQEVEKIWLYFTGLIESRKKERTSF